MYVKEVVVGVSIVLSAAGIGWFVNTLIEVDKRTAIMAEKVSENHKMIKPLWEDFIRRSKPDGNLAEFDGETDSKAWFKWK